MTFLKNHHGTVKHISEWQHDVDQFWKCFDIKTDWCTQARLPKRPIDAWERFVKIQGLEQCDE